MQRLAVIGLFTALLSGCASVSSPFYDSDQPLLRHAVLQTLNGSMRKNPGNPLNPFNSGNWTTLIDGLKKLDAPDWEPLGRNANLYWIRVRPDSYMARIKCTGKGFHVWFEIALPDLLPGRDYLLECHGFSAAEVKVQISDQPTAVPSRAASSPGKT